MMNPVTLRRFCCALAVLTGSLAQAATSVDAQLMNACAARTDARMESMTLRKLEQIRNYEFSLRIAMAQIAPGESAMSSDEWRLALANLRQARRQLAQVCGVSVPVG
jgi:hypothetical protein